MKKYIDSTEKVTFPSQPVKHEAFGKTMDKFYDSFTFQSAWVIGLLKTGNLSLEEISNITDLSIEFVRAIEIEFRVRNRIIAILDLRELRKFTAEEVANMTKESLTFVLKSWELNPMKD